MPRFVFLGNDEFAAAALGGLIESGLRPRLVITNPNRSRTRGRSLSATPAGQLAAANGISVIKPENLSPWPAVIDGQDDFFLVVSYGKILPVEFLSRARLGAINLHPSLLPEFRGPAPIAGAILAGREVSGVTIMILDEQFDHGPIIDQCRVDIAGRTAGRALSVLAEVGVERLHDVIPRWLADEIIPRPQDHRLATYTTRLKKSDGRLNLNDPPALNYRKFLACTPRPGAHMVYSNGVRLSVKQARLTDGQFIVERVTPAGRREMDFEDFKRGVKNREANF